MDRSVAALISLTLAACGQDAASSSCLDQAEWQIALSHAGRTESTLAVGSEGVYVAIGDANADVQFGSQTIHGAYLAHIASDGTVLALARAPDGDGMTGPVGLHVDGDENLYVAWTSAHRTVVAVYNEALERRWLYENAGQFALSFDVDEAGNSALLTRDELTSRRSILRLDYNGAFWWGLDVEHESPTNVVVASNGDVFSWAVSGQGSTRYRHDQVNGAGLDVLGFAGSADVLLRDGGYVGVTDASHLARVDMSGDEIWGRDFEANIGLPIASPQGDILLPAATGSEQELPFVVVLLDAHDGHTRAARGRCARTILWATDEAAYYGIGDGGDHPGSIARFPLR